MGIISISEGLVGRQGLLFLFMYLIGLISVFGQTNAPKYSNEFLNLGVGARGLGMNGAMVSHVGDVTSGYWNPAGLRGLAARQQMMLMHASYFAGIANYDFGAVAFEPDDSSTLALSVIRFSIDDIPDTRFLFDANGALNYDRIRFFSASDYAFLLSYARDIRWLGGISLGANAKVIHRTVGVFSRAWGFGVDLGMQKKWDHWRLGVVARDVFGTFNAWSHNADELRETFELTGNEIPINSTEITLPRLVMGISRMITLGNHFDLLPALDIEATFDGKRNTLLKTNFTSITPRSGLELGYRKTAFFRFGVGGFQQQQTIDSRTIWTLKPNAGLGFVVREVMIDYAFTDVSGQSAGLYSHVFSIKVNFNAKD